MASPVANKKNQDQYDDKEAKPRLKPRYGAHWPQADDGYSGGASSEETQTEEEARYVKPGFSVSGD
jgi:hypothetical protein